MLYCMMWHNYLHIALSKLYYILLCKLLYSYHGIEQSNLQHKRDYSHCNHFRCHFHLQYLLHTDCLDRQSRRKIVLKKVKSVLRMAVRRQQRA